MQHRVTIKDYIFESRLFLRRSIAALFFAALLLGALIARLIYLQVFAHEHYATLSDENRVKIEPLPPNRGLIYDRNGILLAENLPSYRLEITPEQVKNMDDTLDRLSKLVSIRDIDRKRFERLKERTPSFNPVPLRFHLSDEEVARFAVDRYRFPGVEVVAGLSRHYPHGSLAVHAIGYVGRIDERDLQRVDNSNYAGTTHIGKIGVEKTYEDELHGTVGYRQVETNAEGRALRILQTTSPVPGRDLYLTIDARLQAKAEAAFGDRAGTAVVLDPNNGDILAFVSQPGFDPNLFVNGIDTDTYNALQNDSKRPLFNRGLRGQYPPGSTIKPFVGLAGLELGLITEHTSTFCPGYFQLPGKDRKYRDWKHTGHGRVDLNTAITQSCDVYFYDLAQSMGIDRLHDFLSRFGFGKRTGVDIVGELPGLLPSSAWKREARNQPWYPGETLITGIGQGFMLATPLQLADAAATLATYGHHLQPRVVFATQGPDEKTLRPQPVQTLAHLDARDIRHWDAVIEGMHDVVQSAHGTARRVGLDAKYQFAGKTGTAQVYGLKEEEEYDASKIEEQLRDHSLFIAFAPLEKPQLAIAVIVEHGGSGSAVAAPIAREIFDDFLQPPQQEAATP